MRGRMGGKVKGGEKKGREERESGGEGVHEDGENVHKVHANLSAKRPHPVQRVARPHMLSV